MTFAEVLISALILGISSQVGLQGWTRTTQAATAADQLDQQSIQLEQQLLITRRVLTTAPVARHCRFDGDAVDAVLEAWPVDPAITATLEPDPVLDGLWFTVAVGSLQRRQLFTPAGLGHCRAEVS